MILISACLLGICTKYNGESNAHSLIIKYSGEGRYVPVCPEQLGGMPTPRLAAEIKEGTGEDVWAGKAKVFNINDEDITPFFIRGAKEVLKIIQTFPITAAVFKERSPSCGVNLIYDGSYKHITCAGEGVTTAFLRKNKIPVYSENLNELLLKKLLGLVVDESL